MSICQWKSFPLGLVYIAALAALDPVDGTEENQERVNC